MLKRIKTALIPLAVFILLIVNSGIVTAQTFDDVTENTWYFAYVEELVEDEIVEISDEYRPDDALTRAELANMVIEAIDGLSEFEMPAIPTFSDVPVGSQYYDYIEASVQLGIVAGYTDESGNLTGMFGPDDTVNRATATKILINAFNIPIDTEIESIFPDVTENSWYHDYVVNAYDQSIIDGYEDGYFGPADPVTRAQIAKLIVNAQNPVERIEDAEVEVEEMIVTEGSGLIVSLGEVQAPPLTVPLASTAPLINLDLTATDSDVQISEITLTRSGVGNATDWSGVYMYEGDFKITSEYSIDQSSNKVTLPINVFIEAGNTTNVSAYGDTDIYAVPSNQHYFYLSSADDVASDTENVTGDFPLSGNMINIGNQYANTVTIAPGSTLSRPGRDQNSEIASFKLTAGSSSDVSLDAIILTQGGSFNSDQMTDCSLLRDSVVISTAQGFYGDQLIFALETPYIIPNSQTKSFSVKCYVDGGRTTDTIQLYLDEIYDLISTDLDFGFSAAPINGYDQSTAPSVNLRSATFIIQ
ncbi:S-layer homology domain-containing protein [Patescibacteria group bacterium]|nr:S-layer homology domain-containing protein [Patescibacteria group bacterium]